MRISNQHIDDFLKKEDIEGLIEIGAPMDEYSSEAKMISEALEELALSEITAEKIVSAISAIWMKNFNLSEADLALRRPHIEVVAKKILEHLGQAESSR